MNVIMNSLQPEQAFEISNVYVGMIDKVPNRVIVQLVLRRYSIALKL
ncbi:TPA: hypothetical protein QCR38_005101 [Bacillus cereus]|nr:hypothetical protein [Bacillus cereus]